MGCSGFGALAGALTLATRRGVRGLGSWVVAAAASFGCALILFSLSHVFWLSAILLVPVGTTMMVQYDPNSTNVDISGRLYPVSGLERGDVIDVQMSNAGSTLPFAQKVTLVRNVR